VRVNLPVLGPLTLAQLIALALIGTGALLLATPPRRGWRAPEAV
jgi:hypothetical protein